MQKKKRKKKDRVPVGVFCNGSVAHELTPEVLIRCKQCEFEGWVYSFVPTPNPLHDLRCAQCGTVKLDTSEINKFLKGRYGFGDDNILEGTPLDHPDLGE